MERGRSPLVSIPPFGRGFPRHRYGHQPIPQHGCVPAEPASVSPGKIIVAPPRPSVSTNGMVRLARDPDDHLQTEELFIKTAVGSFLDSFTHGRGHYRS